MDVGNAWLHGFTKKKIYTVAKPRGVVRHIILYLQGLGFRAHPPPHPPVGIHPVKNAQQEE